MMIENTLSYIKLLQMHQTPNHRLSYAELLQIYETQNRRLKKLIRISDQQSKKLLGLTQKFEKLAYIDQLTGLYNRHYFFSIANKTMALAQRQKLSFSLAMMDIDDFKKVNDTYGHDVGDKVIQALASETSAFIRQSDIFARFGGEEFILLLPQTTLEQAHILMEKIRQKITKTVVNENIQFTISIGLTHANLKENESIDKLIKHADINLYKAKNAGKNSIVYS